MADIFDSYARGLQVGQQQKQRNQLAELQSLAPQVMSGDLDATSRAFSLDPQTAQSYQTEGNRQQQQLVGLAKTLKQFANNPQMQAGVYRSALPYLKRNFGAEIPDDFDAASVMPIVDQVLAVAQNAPSMGGAGGTLQSQRVLEDGSILNTYRDGRTENTGLKADRQMWLRDNPGMPPELVGKDQIARPVVTGGAAPAPTRSDMEADISLANAMIAAGIPDTQVDAFLASRGSRGGNAQAPAATAQARPSAAQEAFAVANAKNAADNSNFNTSLEQDRLLKEQQARIEADKARAVEQAKSEQERASNERAKSAQLNNVDRGLSRIDQAMKALSGRFVDTGPIDGRIIGPTPQGQELEAAVGAIQNDMLALTRVPGIGSQSDLEAKIANLKYPSIYNAPEVNARNVEQLKAFMKDLRQQIQTSPAQAPTAAPQGRSITRRGRAPDGRSVVQYSDGTIEYGN